jgi:hypothetical protein
MHGHIAGTRRRYNGEFFGLIENDIVPILEGPQVKGKTSLCRWLACEDELYVDLGSGTRQGFGSEETAKKTRGRLIAEIGEMKIMKNADSVETVKSFISAKVATVNIKYVEAQNDLPTTTSFIGTSNPAEYLSDDTGNRRFWPVKINGIDLDFMDKNRDLAKKLHAHYQSRAIKMSKAEVLEECKPSAELNALMESMRKDALITYSDYECCMKLISKWKENNSVQGGCLDQADIERMAMDERYPTRISRRSFTRAVQDTGFEQVRSWSAGSSRAVKVWQWKPYKDEVPF